MKARIISFVLVAVACLCAAARTYTVDEIPNVHLSDSTRYVSNPDGILSQATVVRADSILNYIRRATTAEAVAVVVDNIEPDDIDEFATELFTRWGLGKSDLDNGLLILVAKDLRRAAIRPGYGLEGVMPDITCANILRRDMFPNFREGDYDAGLLSALTRIKYILTDPTVADEIRSDESDADFAGRGEDLSLGDFFRLWFDVGLIITAVMLLILALTILRVRKEAPYRQYKTLVTLRPIYLAMTFVGLAVPAVASIALLLYMKRLRNRPHACPHCGTAMNKMDEETDNRYLNHIQDTEERLGTVDYDVWVCQKCGETDIEPFESTNTVYHRCEHCHGLTASLTRDRILRQPTTSREGLGEKDYTCAACGHVTPVSYALPIKVAAPLIVVVGGGRHRGGGGFGGGFGGGGFGGGMTGGGG
ncbi:MAG: TPM domain-containing protein, partial [Muribaculaceae bacterium]|nr:TPM domain-containing protein [Muribaculaceae bacterium]